jgi:hypothetical protein
VAFAAHEQRQQIEFRLRQDDALALAGSLASFQVQADFPDRQDAVHLARRRHPHADRDERAEATWRDRVAPPGCNDRTPR